ncbi:MAG: HU family DNA-binding protein [Thermodesulfobacteriota bacterium]|jgi:integration host factor subunit beta
MNKSELVAALAKETDLPLRKSEEIVNTVFDTMFRSLVDGDRIEIRGFGSFEIREYDKYLGRNPKTGDQIEVEGKRLPFFKAGKELRLRVDQPREN